MSNTVHGIQLQGGRVIYTLCGRPHGHILQVGYEAALTAFMNYRQTTRLIHDEHTAPKRLMCSFTIGQARFDWTGGHLGKPDLTPPQLCLVDQHGHHHRLYTAHPTDCEAAFTYWYHSRRAANRIAGTFRQTRHKKLYSIQGFKA